MTTTMLLKAALGRPPRDESIQPFNPVADARLVWDEYDRSTALTLIDFGDRAMLIPSDEMHRAMEHMAPPNRALAKLSVSNGTIYENELRALGFPHIKSITHTKETR